MIDARFPKYIEKKENRYKKNQLIRRQKINLLTHFQSVLNSKYYLNNYSTLKFDFVTYFREGLSDVCAAQAANAGLDLFKLEGDKKKTKDLKLCQMLHHKSLSL